LFGDRTFKMINVFGSSYKFSRTKMENFSLKQQHVLYTLKFRLRRHWCWRK